MAAVSNPGQPPQIQVVSGPSSVGKSRFLKSPRFTEITGAQPGVVRLFASGGQVPDKVPAVIHYNIQRPLHRFLTRVEKGQIETGSVAAHATGFRRDPYWRRLLATPGELRAVVLAADLTRLINRVSRRSTTEGSIENYPVETWLERYAAVDISDIYAAWLTELADQRVPVVLVDARDDEYRILDSSEELLAIVEGRGIGCSRGGVEELLQSAVSEYHRVELPFGLATGGSDRSATRDLVLPASLEGKSLLDVGSAGGYFCFEAEARDALRVKGVDLKESRIAQANLLKDLKGSRVEFVQRDVVRNPIEDRWDIVLLLNVIHHVAEPMRLLHDLAEVARECLVIEFPTFADPRFRRHRRIRFPWFYNRSPVVGVSSAIKGVAQTFVFSPEAIRAMLLEQTTSVRSIEFQASPIPGRMIAFARK